MADTKMCPYCGEDIKLDDTCKKCESKPNRGSVKSKAIKPRGNLSIVLGAFGFLLVAFPIITLVSSGTGLYLGIKSLKSAQRNAATAGIILCSIGLFVLLTLTLDGYYISGASTYYGTGNAFLSCESNSSRSLERQIERLNKKEQDALGEALDREYMARKAFERNPGLSAAYLREAEKYRAEAKRYTIRIMELRTQLEEMNQ